MDKVDITPILSYSTSTSLANKILQWKQLTSLMVYLDHDPQVRHGLQLQNQHHDQVIAVSRANDILIVCKVYCRM